MKWIPATTATVTATDTEPMRGPLPTSCSLLLLSLFAGAVHAERWDFTPTLSVREIYTDNLMLTEEDPQADWVTELTPGFSLRGQNDLLKLNFSASSQNLYYREGDSTDGDNSQSNSQLQLQSTTTLLPSFFFLDVGGNAGQRIVSQNNQLSYDNVALTGDRSDYSAYTLAPYIKYKSRAGINLEARAERGVNKYDSEDAASEDMLSDATTENYRFLLDNGGMQSKLDWRLQATRRYLDRESDELSDPDIRQGQADLGYSLSGSFSVLARAGRSENSLGGYDNDRNGDYSAGGFRWSPSRRFSLSAMAGSNYNDAELNWRPSRRTDMMFGYRDTDVGLIVGPSWRSNIRFRGRRASATLTYNEEVTTEQQLLLETVTVTVIDPVTGPRTEDITFFFIADDEFERHRGALTLN